MKSDRVQFINILFDGNNLKMFDKIIYCVLLQTNLTL